MGSDLEATVKTLTAEVRCLMIGNRQVTLSVYRQLDEVGCHDIEPFGRVSDARDSARGQSGAVHVVGRKMKGEALVRSHCCPREWQETVWPDSSDWLRTGPFRKWAEPGENPWMIKDPEERAEAKRVRQELKELPERPPYAHILTRGDLMRRWRIPRDNKYFTSNKERALVDERIPSGKWSFSSSEARAEALRVTRKDMDDYEAHCQLYYSWQDLHLIVLAGLR